MSRFFNAHAHCFTMDHVPAYFFSRWLPVAKLLNRKWIKKLVQKGPVTGRMPIVVKVLVALLSLLNLISYSKFKRLLTMVRYGSTDSQEKVINAMRQYYPNNTGIVFLTMDMEYMGAGLPEKRYIEQLSELATIKNSIDEDTGEYKYKDKIYPFIFIDPRRINPTIEREKTVDDTFIGKTFLKQVERYIKSGDFQGFKLYPALGYYPFDTRLQPAYNLAIEYDLPIISHCTIGSVHFKYKLNQAERFHPITQIPLPNDKPSLYQEYISHPLNYECLLNKELLRKTWGDSAPDYKNLKMCIGHWGSENDWKRYLNNDWADVYEYTKGETCPALDLKNWHIDKEKRHLNFTWFSIIYELLKSNKYPNLYTDISYTLNDRDLLPTLKVMLESNQHVREHVLFGTDFYMVSKAVSERAFSINLRASLGEGLFHQIAVVNARKFISNKIVQVE